LARQQAPADQDFFSAAVDASAGFAFDADDSDDDESPDFPAAAVPSFESFPFVSAGADDFFA
jgi:hypothetical protein